MKKQHTMIKNFIPRLAEIGKIKIGGKGEKRKSPSSGKEYQIPVKFEHFVITTMEKDASNNFRTDKHIMKQIGTEAKEIDISLLYDDISLNFLNSYAFYAGKKCICRGNGETAQRTNKEGKTTNVKCDVFQCPYMLDRKCKPNGILSCVLPQSDKVGGVYKFRTTSWYSVQNILSSLMYIATKTNGILAGIPLKLCFSKRATESHGNVPVVNLMSCEGEQKLLESVVTEKKRRDRFNLDIKQIESSAIESGIIDDNDDPEDIESEYYSEPESIDKSIQADLINENQFEVPADTEIVESKDDTSPVEPEQKEVKKDVSDML
jgi:hypothetical protein